MVVRRLHKGLEGLRFEPIEDALERVMRGNAAGQGEKASEPTVPLAAKEFDFLPVLDARQDCTQGDDDESYVCPRRNQPARKNLGGLWSVGPASSKVRPSRSASAWTSLAAASPITVPGPNTAAAPASNSAG